MTLTTILDGVMPVQSAAIPKNRMISKSERLLGILRGVVNGDLRERTLYSLDFTAIPSWKVHFLLLNAEGFDEHFVSNEAREAFFDEYHPGPTADRQMITSNLGVDLLDGRSNNIGNVLTQVEAIANESNRDEDVMQRVSEIVNDYFSIGIMGYLMLREEEWEGLGRDDSALDYAVRAVEYNSLLGMAEGFFNDCKELGVEFAPLTRTDWRYLQERFESTSIKDVRELGSKAVDQAIETYLSLNCIRMKKGFKVDYEAFVGDIVLVEKFASDLGLSMMPKLEWIKKDVSLKMRREIGSSAYMQLYQQKKRELELPKLVAGVNYQEVA